MKKSVIFLINGLGIEKAGSYSISIDQCMPNLSRTKETSYFTTAIISSLEYHEAYKKFFLGDTSRIEIDNLKDNILTESIKENESFLKFQNDISIEESRLHIFVEPNSDLYLDQINSFLDKIQTESNKQIFIHLLLTAQTTSEYEKLGNIINNMKTHLNKNATIGMILGSEFFKETIEKAELDYGKNLFFYGSVERWIDTKKKLEMLRDSNIRPCDVPGFCSINDYAIKDNDTVLFFNTTRANYDNILNVMFANYETVFKTKDVHIKYYSLIRLDSKHQIPFFSENIEYKNSFVNILQKANKKALIIANDKFISYMNFLANGMNYVNNPNLAFMKINDEYLNNKENIINIIDKSNYDIIIFDYHMDALANINIMKEQLTRIDQVLGNVVEVCTNKHSLFITSLYGMKKTLPLADYNPELVTIDYEMQIPIFFYDYSYVRSKYHLVPGETNDILNTAICCVWDNKELYSLIRVKGLINNLLGKR